MDPQDNLSAIPQMNSVHRILADFDGLNGGERQIPPRLRQGCESHQQVRLVCDGH
jgi:hypothetical protein